MNIVYTHGSGYSSAPSWLPRVLAEVAAFFDKTFTNNVTIDVRVNWVDLGKEVLASNSNNTVGVDVSLSALSAALVAHEQTATQRAAYANLPSGVSQVYVAPAEADALGLGVAPTSINLYVGSKVAWSQFDAFAAIAHEITETAMGRISQPGSDPTVMDMFRYSSPGHHDLTAGSATSNITAYFSTNNGKTNLGAWNNDSTAGYDYGDWVVSGFPNTNDPEGVPISNDAFGAQEGGTAPISETDIALMSVLGWSTDIVTSADVLSVGHGVTQSGITVMDGGAMKVLSGGVSSDTWYTDARGLDSGVIEAGVSGGGSARGFVYSGGVETSATLDAGGTETVYLGGVADASRVMSFGIVSALGSTDGVLLSGGKEIVGGGGRGSATHVLKGGVEYVASGGLTIGAIVASGGTERVSAGGAASAATISAGGTLVVASAGSAIEAQVLAGGRLVLDGAASWSGATTRALAGTLAGGGQLIEAGPGVLVVSAVATTFSGEVVIDGGTVELAAALGAGRVDFAATATKKTLKIDAADRPANGATFATTLIDFDSASATYVDLAGQAFVAGATATLSGHTLTLRDGAYTAAFTLAGTGASKYAVVSDGAGGIEIRAATGSTKTPLLAQAAAGFTVSGAPAGLSTVSAGGAPVLGIGPPHHLGSSTGRAAFA
jgi:autotransporter passenger strand-loop-strand repeat protein/autotransporter-associated beta strand protein